MSISHWGIFPGSVWTTTLDWSCWFVPTTWEDYCARRANDPYPSATLAHKVLWAGVWAT